MAGPADRRPAGCLRAQPIRSCRPADSVWKAAATSIRSAWGPARIGFGAALTFARGTATATVEGTPDVVTRSTTLAPQLSFNFGHRLGWSYLSAGYGAAKVVSESATVGTGRRRRPTPGWGGAMNVGGGARWFVTDASASGSRPAGTCCRRARRSASSPAAPRATLFQLAVGLSIH